MWSWTKTIFSLACNTEGGVHARMGEESRFEGRLALARAFLKVVVCSREGFVDGGGEKDILGGVSR